MKRSNKVNVNVYFVKWWRWSQLSCKSGYSHEYCSCPGQNTLANSGFQLYWKENNSCSNADKFPCSNHALPRLFQMQQKSKQLQNVCQYKWRNWCWYSVSLDVTLTAFTSSRLKLHGLLRLHLIDIQFSLWWGGIKHDKPLTALWVMSVSFGIII